MNEIQKYIAANEPKIMEDLFSLIRIPSISALPEHHDDMLACAQRWAQLLLEAGVEEALVMPSKGNPIVFAQKIVDPNAKTVLVYAHYDVMPAEPLELWKSQPFEPEVRDGYIWARGADDDKGQSFIQVKAFEYLVIKIKEREKTAKQVSAQYEQQLAENERLQKVADGGSQEDYIERVAREKLGYVMPDEKVYYDITPGN